MSNNPEKNNTDSDKEESLAERSARLEAEAMGMYKKGSSSDKEKDPLAPEPHPEDASYGEDAAAPAPNAGAPSADAIALQQKVDTLQAELDQTKDKMMRAVADAENTKRRALKDRDDSTKFAVSGFSRDLLPVADNLKRALDAFPDELKENEQIANLMQGIEATERELIRTFEKYGLVKMEPLNKIFDPNFHEVMFEMSDPTKPAGTIVQVMETGYTLHERLIRPARVGVVKDEGQGGGQTPSQEPGHNIDTEA